MRLKIDGFDHQGRGIAHYNNKVYFIFNALPDEEVEIEILKEKKNIVTGKVIKYYKKNDDLRTDTKCPFYGICGGCDIMHIKDQNGYKLDKLNNIINKYVDKNIKVLDVVNLNEYNYRNKITLQVCNNEIGLYKKNSNDIVCIDKCYLVDDRINKIIDLIKKNQNLNGIKQIVIKCMDESMVTFIGDDNVNYDYLKSVVDSIYVNKKNVYGKSKITVYMGNFKFLVSSESFFQVNTLVANAMYNYIDSLIDKTNVIFDLYCGTGTIGIFVSNKANRVIGLEINSEAVRDANENKKINNINNIDFYEGDASSIVKKTDLKPDVIIVDPPRSGLDDKMIMDINKLLPKKIIYVSCDPMTLARDLKKLDNYNIISIKGFNMFPNTYHVESVTLLERK